MADRRVLITGASAGIGRATAYRLGAAGASILLVARRRARLDAIADDLAASGAEAHVLPADLMDGEQVDELIARVQVEHGGIDVLINNAGVSLRRPICESLERFSDLERTLTLNCLGPVRLILGLLPSMIEQRYGHIVNVSTVGLEGDLPRFSAYHASKAALDAYTHSFAPELLRCGVKTTTIYMPLVRTAMSAPTEEYRQLPGINAAAAADILAQALMRRPYRIATPAGRLGELLRAVSPTIMRALQAANYNRDLVASALASREQGHR